jgi:hypothetical protein
MTGQRLRDHERARLWRDQGASSCAGLGLVTEEFDTLGLKASHFCVHAALPGNPNPLSGAGAKKQGFVARLSKHSGAPQEKFPPITAPRLHRRPALRPGKALHQECSRRAQIA